MYTKDGHLDVRHVVLGWVVNRMNLKKEAEAGVW